MNWPGVWPNVGHDPTWDHPGQKEAAAVELALEPDTGPKHRDPRLKLPVQLEQERRQHPRPNADKKLGTDGNSNIFPQAWKWHNEGCNEPGWRENPWFKKQANKNKGRGNRRSAWDTNKEANVALKNEQKPISIFELWAKDRDQLLHKELKIFRES